MAGPVREMHREDTGMLWELSAALMEWACRIMGNGGCACSIIVWFICIVVRE